MSAGSSGHGPAGSGRGNEDRRLDGRTGRDSRGGPARGNQARASGRERVNYPFFEYVTGNIDLGQLGSFGRIDFEPRLYGSPRPLERTGPEAGQADPESGYNWRTYRRAPGGDSGYAVEDLLERLDTPYTEAIERPRLPRPAQRPDWRPGDDEPARGRGSGRSRAVLTLVDQILSSGTNAAMAFLIARAVSASEFGAFGIAFVVFAVAIGFGRAAGTAPLGIRFAAANRGDFRRAARAATGTALLLAVTVGAGTLLVGLALGGAPGRALMAMGAVLPGLMVQDSWRYVFFAQGRPGAAALNDLVWAAVQGLGFAVLLIASAHSSAEFILVWGLSALLASLVGGLQARTLPKPAAAWAWIREHREIAGYMSAEFVTVQGALQASTLLIGTLGTIEIVGALRGTQTLLGPTSVLAIGILSFAIPELARRADMTARERMRAAWLLSAAVSVAGVAWGGFFLLVPDRVGLALLGKSWPLTHSILVPSIIQQAAAAIMIGPACVLYSLGKARVTFRLHATQAPLLVVCSVVGLEVADARGTAWGFAVAFWTMVPLSFLLLRRELRGAGREAGDEAGVPAGSDDSGELGQRGAVDGSDGLDEGHGDGDGDDDGKGIARDGREAAAQPAASAAAAAERIEDLGEPFREGDGIAPGVPRRRSPAWGGAATRRAAPRSGPGSR